MFLISLSIFQRTLRRLAARRTELCVPAANIFHRTALIQINAKQLSSRLVKTEVRPIHPIPFPIESPRCCWSTVGTVCRPDSLSPRGQACLHVCFVCVFFLLSGNVPISYLCIDVNHGRQQKCQRLSTSRRTDSDSVLPLQSHGPALRLNRSRGVETTLENLGKDVFRHRCFLEGHARLRNVLSNDHDSLRLSPLGSFFFASFCHVGVFHVKVLLEGHQLFLGKINVLQIGSEVGSAAAPAVSVATAASVAAATAASVATTATVAAAAATSVARTRLRRIRVESIDQNVRCRVKKRVSGTAQGNFSWFLPSAAAAVVSTAPIAGATSSVTAAATSVASAAVTTAVS
ncbi:unnamed protein product [Pseudo-nitzschia multistriata]|uniref:Uncharacterized protein n=1 Tax=Pseudo-nitzschia multistriata TaxID=183589 RepID=A0A448ZKI8_9STRA|nr:unnamed protein product [Pseudo-nitzschia multistriata]